MHSLRADIMMFASFLPVVLGSILLLIKNVNGACYDPSPAFPPPKLDAGDPVFRSAFNSLEATIKSLDEDTAFNATSFSIQVTSSQSTLWSYHHTAPELNSSRPGANPVDENSFYRIASITKTFTTLGILKQAAAGNLSLDDPVKKYLPDLKGSIPWKDITLRTLASQLSGIPRDWSQGELPNATLFGLPPPNNTALPTCYGYNERFLPCNSTDLYDAMSLAQPVFPPNKHSTYSNTNFELLGLVLANVSGLSYEDAIATHILGPLNISSDGATFVPPRDDISVLPSGIQWYHDVNQGVHNPTGGLFMTSSAMSTFLRHVLTHFNSPSTLSLEAGNWFSPHSFTPSTTSYYGMPWEIFRTDTILLNDDRNENRRAKGRVVPFYTKGGGLPGYVSFIILAPEYDLAFTLFLAGNGELLYKLREAVTVNIIRAAEEVAARQMTKRYAGTYATDGGLNSSLALGYSSEKGLYIETWISNGTAVLQAFRRAYPDVLKPGARAQVVPTGVYVDEEGQTGEKWRVVIVPPRPEEGDGGTAGTEQREEGGKVGPQGDEVGVWDEMCVTDVDFLMYDGRPLNEVVFWRDDGGDGDGRVKEVELTAFRVRMGRKEDGGEKVVLQRAEL